jgi:hypothetical protein
VSLSALSECWGSDFPTEAEGVSAQTVRLVALAVADVVNDMHGNEFWASSATVANKLDCHKDTVQDALKHLTTVGVLQVVSKQRGKPTRFRWIGMKGVQVDDLHSGTSAGEPPSVVQVTSPANTNGTQEELKAQTSSADELDSSPAQIPMKKVDHAKAIVDELWEAIKLKTDKKPMIKYMGTVKVVEQAVGEWDDREILRALCALWEASRPITIQTLGERLNGMVAKPKQSSIMDSISKIRERDSQ